MSNRQMTVTVTLDNANGRSAFISHLRLILSGLDTKYKRLEGGFAVMQNIMLSDMIP